MNLAQLVPIVLQVSVGLMVFCVALQASQGDLTYLLRRPSLMLRSLNFYLVNTSDIVNQIF